VTGISVTDATGSSNPARDVQLEPVLMKAHQRLDVAIRRPCRIPATSSSGEEAIDRPAARSELPWLDDDRPANASATRAGNSFSQVTPRSRHSPAARQPGDDRVTPVLGGEYLRPRAVHAMAEASTPDHVPAHPPESAGPDASVLAERAVQHRDEDVDADAAVWSVDSTPPGTSVEPRTPGASVTSVSRDLWGSALKPPMPEIVAHPPAIGRESM